MMIPKKLVVIAPHPDDETLGAGGSIAKFSDLGTRVHVLIVSGHLPPLYPAESFQVTRKESENAASILGVESIEFLQIPATTVHLIPISELNRKISFFINSHKPEMVMLPFPDRHIDHRTIFDSSIVACRPVTPSAPRVVLLYETLSETHWNVPGVEPSFSPDFFINISGQISKKELALQAYQTQIKDAPSRSIEAARALAKFRGSQNGCDYAEAFKVARIVL